MPEHELSELGLIGAGGCANVYRVIHAVTQTAFAMKRALPEVADTANNGEMLQHEASILRSLSSRHIVGFHGEGHHEGLRYILLDLADRGSLSDRLTAGLVGDPWSAARIGDAIASALEMVHGSGLVHRDVHPGNLLIATRLTDSQCPPSCIRLLHDDEDLVLSDFGIACFPEDEQPTPWRHIGTPLFSAPEQLEPNRQVSLQTDVFAATATIWSVISGSKPPTPRSVGEVLDYLQPAWASFVCIGMHSDPESRFSSVQAWRESLYTAINEDLRKAGHDNVG